MKDEMKALVEAARGKTVEEFWDEFYATNGVGHGHNQAQAEHGHGHGHGHGHAGAGDATPDDDGAPAGTVWSGNANDLLVREVADLPPGRALDLGCGEGGDAVWLAGLGWQVTATDVAQLALDRGAAAAADAGVGHRIDWQRHNLARSFPDGEFDLVSACYLQSFVELPREVVLRRAAAAVAPGGRLVVVSHAGWPAWVDEEDMADMGLPPFRTASELRSDLDLPDAEWETVVAEEVGRPIDDPDGNPGVRPDNVLHLRRR